MPEGSSSEAPVIKPGPKILKNFFIGFGSCSMAASSDAVPAAGCLCGILGLSSSGVTCCDGLIVHRARAHCPMIGARLQGRISQQQSRLYASPCALPVSETMTIKTMRWARAFLRIVLLLFTALEAYIS